MLWKGKTLTLVSSDLTTPVLRSVLEPVFTVFVLVTKNKDFLGWNVRWFDHGFALVVLYHWVGGCAICGCMFPYTPYGIFPKGNSFKTFSSFFGYMQTKKNVMSQFKVYFSRLNIMYNSEVAYLLTKYYCLSLTFRITKPIKDKHGRDTVNLLWVCSDIWMYLPTQIRVLWTEREKHEREDWIKRNSNTFLLLTYVFMAGWCIFLSTFSCFLLTPPRWCMTQVSSAPIMPWELLCWQWVVLHALHSIAICNQSLATICTC